MSNWSNEFGGILVFETGSAPITIPADYIAVYASGSDGSIYYKAPNSAEIKIG